jgi:hypothetical protein
MAPVSASLLSGRVAVATAHWKTAYYVLALVHDFAGRCTFFGIHKVRDFAVPFATHVARPLGFLGSHALLNVPRVSVGFRLLELRKPHRQDLLQQHPSVAVFLDQDELLSVG